MLAERDPQNMGVSLENKMGRRRRRKEEIRWLGHVGIISRALTGCAGVMGQERISVRGQQASVLGHWSDMWTHPIPDAQEHSPHFGPIVSRILAVPILKGLCVYPSLVMIVPSLHFKISLVSCYLNNS